jgi:hypothetical protein
MPESMLSLNGFVNYCLLGGHSALEMGAPQLCRQSRDCIEDHFLRNYISKVAGETEIIRECNRQTKACRGVKAMRMGNRKARRSHSGRRVAVPNRRQRNLSSTRNQVNWQNS